MNVTNAPELAAEATTARFCLTAEECFPELERQFLSARREIVASYRIFDLATRLRSDEGRAIGEDWFDLIVHILKNDVSFTFYLTDFDPVASSALHRGTWRSLRRLVAASEMAGLDAARLHVLTAPHPARVGLLPTLFFMPRVVRELRRDASWLGRMTPAQRRRALQEMPGLAPFMRVEDGRVRPRYGLPELIPATHHQKVAVFDRQRLCVGGLDLNERRYDTPAHDRPAAETWHDVQLFLDDPERAQAAVRHVLTLQRVTGGLMRPPPAPGLSRTLSRRRRFNLPFLSPRNVVKEISRVHRARIASARRLIYLETQFFRDLATARRLARAARANRELTLILIVPAAPEDVAFEGRRRADVRLGEFLQARCIGTIRRAFGPRVFIASPVQPRRYESGQRDSLWGGPIIYVHAKVSIFDEDAAMVSSANLNGRSLYWDTELGVELTRAADVRALRRRCFEHWLPEDAGPELHDPATACEAWRTLAVQNLHRAPEERRGFLLPYDPTPAERFGRDVAAVPNEIV